MANYTVAFRVDIDADCPTTAAVTALEQMQLGCPDSVFLVRADSGDVFEVDFSNCDAACIDDGVAGSDAIAAVPDVAAAATMLLRAIANAITEKCRGIFRKVATA